MVINTKVMRLPLHEGTRVNYMDVTPWVKFGQPNTLTLIPWDHRQLKPAPLEVKRITLQRVQF